MHDYSRTHRVFVFSLALVFVLCPLLWVCADEVLANERNENAGGARLAQKTASCLSVSRADGEIVLQQTLAPDERFILRHRHSVHRSLVVEYLGAGPDGTIAILEGQFEDYGAGLPQKAENGQKLEFKGGKAHLTLAPTRLPRIELRVGRIAEHAVIIRGKVFTLAEHIEPGMVAVLKMDTKACPRERP